MVETDASLLDRVGNNDLVIGERLGPVFRWCHARKGYPPPRQDGAIYLCGMYRVAGRCLVH